MKMNPILKDVLKNLKVNDLYKRENQKYGLDIYNSHICIPSKMRADRLMPPKGALFIFSNYGFKDLKGEQLVDVANFISDELELINPQIEKINNSGIRLFLNKDLKDWEY